MGEMASTLAHELNQPLSAIANYLKGSRRLLEGVVDERVGADARRPGQGRRAGAARRPDHPPAARFRRRGESERRVESVAKLVEEASALALVGAKERGVRVRFQFDPAVDLVLADQVQIQQVLLNLIRNAIEAMADVADARPGDRRSPPAEDNMVRDQRRRHRPGHRAGDRRAAVPALRHHQAARHGRRPVDLAHHRRGPWRADLGGAQPGRRHDLPFHRCAARERRGCRRCRLSAVVHVIDDDEAVRAIAGLPARDGRHRGAQPIESAAAFLEIAAGDRRPAASSPTCACRRSTAWSCCAACTELGVDLPVIVITGHGDVPLAVEAMKPGAVDFLEKPFDDEPADAAVRAALEPGRRRTASAMPSSPTSTTSWRRCRTASARCWTAWSPASQQDHRLRSRHQPAHGRDLPRQRDDQDGGRQPVRPGAHGDAAGMESTVVKRIRLRSFPRKRESRPARSLRRCPA